MRDIYARKPASSSSWAGLMVNSSIWSLTSLILANGLLVFELETVKPTLRISSLLHVSECGSLD